MSKVKMSTTTPIFLFDGSIAIECETKLLPFRFATFDQYKLCLVLNDNFEITDELTFDIITEKMLCYLDESDHYNLTTQGLEIASQCPYELADKHFDNLPVYQKECLKKIFF